jgi:hypothetical protein
VYDWERVGEDDLEPAPKAAASDDLFTDDDLEEGVQWISARHPRFLPEYRKRVWEQAYRDGESSREADYTAAFEEWPQMLYRDDVTAFAKRVRAEVLRQAADEWESPDGVGGPIATWLRARADAEETTP